MIDYKDTTILPISTKHWKSRIYKSWESLSQSLALGLEQLLEKAVQIKPDAATLHIFYLRSSVCNQRPYFRLYLLDENMYNGSMDCWVYWEMPDLINLIRQAFPIEVQPNSPDRKLEALLEQKHLECAEFLYAALGKMIPGLLDSAQKEMSACISVPIYFGEYMTEGRLLYSPTSERKGVSANA